MNVKCNNCIEKIYICSLFVSESSPSYVYCYATSFTCVCWLALVHWYGFHVIPFRHFSCIPQVCVSGLKWLSFFFFVSYSSWTLMNLLVGVHYIAIHVWYNCFKPTWGITPVLFLYRKLMQYWERSYQQKMKRKFWRNLKILKIGRGSGWERV